MDLLKTVYDRVQQLAKKDMAGYGDPTTFNDNIRAFERDFIHFLVDQYKLTNKIPSLLNKLFINSDETITSGQVNYPSDMYLFLDAYRIESDTSLSQMHPLGVSEIGVLNNSVRQPNATKKRYMYQQQNALLVYPSTITGEVRLVYIKKPTDTTIVFDYTSTANGDVAVYNAGTSVQPEFPESALNYLIYGVARGYGIEINDPELTQYALVPKGDATMKGLAV